MDSAHFLLLRNRDHPVRAGAGADGGFVRVWIRIGEVLFYSFFLWQPRKRAKGAWYGRGADRMAAEAPARPRSFSLCHRKVLKVSRLKLLAQCTLIAPREYKIQFPEQKCIFFFFSIFWISHSRLEFFFIIKILLMSKEADKSFVFALKN